MGGTQTLPCTGPGGDRTGRSQQPAYKIPGWRGRGPGAAVRAARPTAKCWGLAGASAWG